MSGPGEKGMVSERRNYRVLNTQAAKVIALRHIMEESYYSADLSFGLPEIQDRYHAWKVPLLYRQMPVGDIFVDAYGGNVDAALSSDREVIMARIDQNKRQKRAASAENRRKAKGYTVSSLKNMVIRGRAEAALKTLPDQSVDLIFTSPPYYNARKQYSEYASYEDYLLQMRQVIRECRRVLMDGKFFVMNSAHVLIPRTNRNESSTRLAVPFDLHQVFQEEGFEFVDDILWQKPEGAGWASGRGRRFAADRNPMQYKTVPVTEYVMVYRKKPCMLIDHFIRNHPDPAVVRDSKIGDGYEKTNVWYISPAHDKRHPAVFPAELAEKVIAYYSFKNDVVLDPFAGIGTTGKAAWNLGRRFCMIEVADPYIQETLDDLDQYAGNLLQGLTYEYLDLSDLEAPPKPKSFDALVQKALAAGKSKDELYDLLKEALDKGK